MLFYIHILTLIKIDIGNEKQKYTGKKRNTIRFHQGSLVFSKSASPAQLINRDISPYGQVIPNSSSEEGYQKI